MRRFGYAGKRVLVAGSGSGTSTFELVRKTDPAVGLEPVIEMRLMAIEMQRRLSAENVVFVYGIAEDLPDWLMEAFEVITRRQGVRIRRLRPGRPGGILE